MAIRSATAATASVNGWDANIRGDTRKRGVSFDQRYDTVLQMQEKGARTWEIELPTGGYEVFIACGDAAYTDQMDTLDVESLIFTDPDGSDQMVTMRHDAAGVMIRLYRAE